MAYVCLRPSATPCPAAPALLHAGRPLTSRCEPRSKSSPGGNTDAAGAGAGAEPGAEAAGGGGRGGQPAGGTPLVLSGPLWTGPLHNLDDLLEMREEARGRGWAGAGAGCGTDAPSVLPQGAHSLQAAEEEGAQPRPRQQQQQQQCSADRPPAAAAAANRGAEQPLEQRDGSGRHTPAASGSAAARKGSRQVACVPPAGAALLFSMP